MDSPFNQGIGRGQSSMSPLTPSGSSSYQVNVNRTKTKKWTEAKIHSYDGDDWGADEYDDEEESEPDQPPVSQPPVSQPPVSQPPTKQPAVGVGAAPPPSARSVHDAAPGPTPAGGLPSLQTRQPPAATPSIQTRSVAITSPVVSDPSIIRSPLDYERVVSPQSIAPARALTASPPELAQSAGKPLPFIRPSDIYRRLDEDKEREHSPMEEPRPNLDNKACSLGDTVKESQRGSIGRDDKFHVQIGAAAEFDGDEEPRFVSSLKLPDVARMSTFGPDMFSPTATATALPAGPVIPENDSNGSSLPSPPQIKADGIKPEAPASVPHAAPPPPVAQEMATEKPEREQLFAPSQQPQSTAQPSSEAEEEQEADVDHHHSTEKSAVETTEIPAAADTSAHGEPRERADVEGPSPISEQHEAVPGATGATAISHAESQHPALQLDSGLPAIQPLQTPSTRRPTENIPSLASPHRAASNVSDRKPIQSPESKLRDGPEQDSEPNPMHRKPTFSIVTSSPVRDSDVLSDEILRSLSPGGAAPADPSFGDGGKTLQPGSHSAARESSYTLGDYDSYWADKSGKHEPGAERDNDAKAPVPVVLPVVPVDEHSANTPPEPSKADDKPVSPGAPVLRRRFSWEADESETMPPPQPSTSREPPAAAAPVVQAEKTPAVPATDAGNMPPSTETEAPKTADAAPVLIVVSHQEQEQPMVVQPTVPEPPSPVSAVSEKQPPTVQESTRLSLADASPPLEAHSALVGQSPNETAAPQPRGQPAPAQIMTFREIMGMPTSADRVTKYNETRDYFASTESGLENWLASLKDQHPEYANGPMSFSLAATHEPAQGGSNPASAGAPAPAQQPHYQQYLRASSPTTSSTSPSSRSRLGGLQMPAQATGNTFGHSSNQIGTKSKEFMHSAGKMGKGLLSKGKNKLRGSGDKGESFPPPVQPKVKNERRISWGLGLGARSEPSPQANAETGSQANNAPLADDTPRPTSFSHSAQHGRSSQRGPPTPGQPHYTMGHGQHPPVQALHPRGSAGRATVGLCKLEIPTGGPMVKSAGLSLATGNGPTQPKRAHKTSWRPEQTTAAAEDQELNDWVVVPSQPGHQQQAPVAEPNSMPRAPAVPVAEDSGVALQSQSLAGEDLPQRTSSFVGLPPIRISSPFSLKSMAKRASQRFSLDDDDDVVEGLFATDYGENEATEPQAESEMPHSRGSSPVTQVASTAEPPADELNPTVSVSKEHVAQDTEVPEPPAQTGHQAPQQPLQDAVSPGPPVQPAPPAARQQMTNPVQKLGTGTWKLEESHLSEPLHQVCRNRSGTDSSQQPVFYGYDKETGLSTPDHPPPPTNPRQRTCDVPPSSAQRYPELFSRPPDHEGQRPGANCRTSGQPYPQPYQASITRGAAMLPRTEGSAFAIAGVGPPEEERGRSRRNSGVFKDISDRIARATSRERRPFMAEPRPTADIRRDEMSESSVATSDVPDRKKRRPSFFSLGGRASMDQGSQREESLGGHNRSWSDLQAPAQSERRRFFFGVGVGGKLQSSTTSLMNDSSSAVANTNEEEATPKKKRFSNMTNVSGIKAMLRRSGQDHGEEPRAHKPDPRASVQHQEHIGETGPPPVPFQGRGRSSTTSSFDLVPPQPIAGEGSPEKRGRRGSASELISGFFGRRSGSRTRAGFSGHGLLTAEQQYQDQQQFKQPQISGGLPPPDTQPQGPPGRRPSDLAVRPGHGRAASMDACRPPHMIVQQVPLPPVQQPRPSPLGLGSPLTHGDSFAEGRARGLVLDPRAAGKPLVDFGHARKLSEPLIPPHHKAAAAKKERSLPLAGIGAQHDAFGQVEPLQRSTLSPDLSVTSDGKAVEQQPVQLHGEGEPEPGKDEAPGRLVSDLATDGAEFQAPSADDRQIQTGVSSDVPSDHKIAAQFHHGAGNQHRSSAPSSLVMGVQTQDTRDHVGEVGPRAGKPMSSGQRKHQQHGAMIPPSQSTFTQPQGQRPPGTVGLPQQQQQPLIQSLARDRMAGPRQMQLPTQPSPARPQESRLPASRSQLEQRAGQGSDPRWKSLKNRVSEQMALIALQTQSKPYKGDKTSRSKRLGALAFRRGSKDAQPQGQVHGGPEQGAPKWQQPRVPGQPWSDQYQQQATVQPPPRNTTPQGQHPFPSGSRMARGGAPRQNMHSQQSAPPMGPQQPQALPQPEPAYGHVPIPRGYHAARGDGMVVPTAYSVGRHTYGQYAQHQQPRISNQGYGQRQPQQTPPMGQGGFPRHESVSSFGMASSPSPPSFEGRRVSAGLGDVRTHRPSINSLDAGQPPRLDERAGRGSQHDSWQLRSDALQRRSSDGSHVSVDAVTVSQQSKSPDLSMGNGSAAERKSQPLTAKHDSTPRLNMDSTGRSQRPAEMARTESGDTVSMHNGPTKARHADNKPAAELDDTADRYQRSRRLESQEEKILYHPEDDTPQMSATSYPGQEWNPYGEPGFGDWKDD
ncbi:Uncharacterized protein TCAP_04825 [Tolypocladium capitatum]|uniref:Uncharacterized protein n=1 Tax=Tolypocladium capitatum TaxID=45235 RepID=A0A2K3QCH9_9HYPO|nr:Uncharacterized protein TCAP_04825 [Tolypocladium capitatum]